MNVFIETYALAFAVAAPLLVLAAMNLYLAFGGERGTLLLPSASVFAMARGRTAANTVPASAPAERPKSPANDPDFRRAA
jgi:hypothetical protein